MLLVVNTSQAVGVRPIDVATTPVDALICCGYKWLCRPYGTGFTWLHSRNLALLGLVAALVLVSSVAAQLAMRRG